MQDLPNLDFLRACAVISVVLEHMLLAYRVPYLGRFPVAWMGVVGVFLFFVHTSLVLMWSMERRPHTLDFYIRRVFRIYPLAICVVCIVLLTHAPLSGSPTAFFSYDPPKVWHKTLASVLLLFNLHGGYLPLGVLWSLPYEVDMYLFLPAAFFFVRKNLSLTPLLAAWLFLVALNRSAFAGQAHNFYLTVPYFLPGVMAYVGFSRHKAKLPAWLFPVGLLAVWIAFLWSPGWRKADWLCLAVGLGLPLFHQIRLPWLKAASHQVAKYSYGLYLCHDLALVIGIHWMAKFPFSLQILTCLALMTVMAVCAYHFVERPFIRLGSRLAQAVSRRFEQKELAMYRIPEAEIQ